MAEYNSNSMLEDMRRLNMVAPGANYSGAVQQGQVEQQQQQQQGDLEWQKAQERAQRVGNEIQSGGDFDADQLASALEYALNDEPMQGQPPQGQPTQQMYQQMHPGNMPPPNMPPPNMPNMPPPNMPPGYPQYPPVGYGAPPPYGQMYAPPPGYYQARGPSIPPGYQQAASMMQQQPGGPLKYTDGMTLQNTSRMKGWELAKLIKSQAMAISSGDDFSDDYYHVKYQEKKIKELYSAQSQMPPQKTRPTELLAEMQTILSEQNSHGGGSVVGRSGPLPVNELSSFTALPNKSIESLAKKTSEWHASHHVLGRSVKTNLKRPRELIASQQGGSIGGTGNTFQSPMWVLRRKLAKIAEKLLAIEDIHSLLDAKVKALRSGLDAHAYSANEAIVHELQQKQVVLCNALGELIGYPSVIDEKTGEYQREKEAELIGGWDTLFFLIWTLKGRQLILRSIPCLLQPHQRAILKTFCTNCAYFVCRNADGQDEDPVTEEEAKLDLVAASTFAEEFSHISDLSFVTDCLRLTYLVFEKSPEVLSIFVHIPAGQEVIRTMLRHGKSLSRKDDIPDDVKQKWNNQSNEFYDIMKIAVAKLETQT